MFTLSVAARVLVGFGLGVVVTAAAEGSALAAALDEIIAAPSFETAGIIVRLSGDDGDETVDVEVRGPEGTDFTSAHPAVRFEPGGAATSLFALLPATEYTVRVTLADPDGVAGPATKTISLRTRAEPSLSTPTRVRWVGTSGRDVADAGTAKSDPYASIAFALEAALPGDEIRVLPGVYSAVVVDGRHGTEAAPIVVRADDPTSRPVIDGDGGGKALFLNDASYVVIDGFEVRNGGGDDDGIGVYLRASARVTVRNCYIHDNGHDNVVISKAPEFSGGGAAAGFHLIEGNVIGDVDHTKGCSGASNDACAGQTYYGIKQDNNPGGGTVIRHNRFFGHVDNMSPCGDEGDGRAIVDGAPVLALVGPGKWTNHDLEIYDNLLEDARDDGVELDGICVNARVYRNHVVDAENALSLAPALPGPFFVVRNVTSGDIKQSAVKLNTGGQSDVPSRHLYFYQNTFTRSTAGTLFNAWFALEGDHNVPIHDVVFRNNVFSSPLGGVAIDSYNHGSEQPSLDGDVWWTTTSAKMFSWWNGTSTDKYDSFAAFQAGTGQEALGAFGEPGLDVDFIPTEGALVIDRAIALPGINDDFIGGAPDVGAFELGAPKPPGPPEGAGGTGAGGTGSGAGGADNGATSAGSGAGGAGIGGDDGGCGCSLPGAGSRRGVGALLVGLAVVGAWRRRRSARPNE